jgi:acyl carrier protein
MTWDECYRSVRELVFDYATPESDDAPLALDSLAVVLLVEAIEDRFGLTLGAKDVTPERFGSLGALVRFVWSLVS